MANKEHIADMRFCYDDYTEDEFNGSTDCTFAIWGTPTDGMDIETYWRLCTHFAAAMGFSSKTINEWFGGEL